MHIQRFANIASIVHIIVQIYFKIKKIFKLLTILVKIVNMLSLMIFPFLFVNTHDFA